MGLHALLWFSGTLAFLPPAPVKDGGGVASSVGLSALFPSCSQCLAGLSMINHVTLSDHIASQTSCIGSVAVAYTWCDLGRLLEHFLCYTWRPLP